MPNSEFDRSDTEPCQASDQNADMGNQGPRLVACNGSFPAPRHAAAASFEPGERALGGLVDPSDLIV